MGGHRYARALPDLEHRLKGLLTAAATRTKSDRKVIGVQSCESIAGGLKPTDLLRCPWWKEFKTEYLLVVPL